MRAVDAAAVDKSLPEHEAMHRLIATLRAIDPASEEYERRFLELMRTVIHHVADEETTLLPAAQRLLGEQLGELGARMTKRKLQLMMPRAGEMARNAAAAMPRNGLLLGAGALIAGAYVVRRAMKRPGWLHR